MNEQRRVHSRSSYLSLKRFDSGKKDEGPGPFLIVVAFVAISFSLIILRLLDLQYVHFKYYQERAENNRYRSVRIPSLRGLILDRAGRPLASVRPSFDLVYYRERGLKDQERVLARLSELTGIDLPILQARVIEAAEDGIPRYIPVILSRDLDWPTLARVECELHRLPGVDIEVYPRREYPQGLIAPHLIGYIDEVSLEDLTSGAFKGARPGDLVGKSGIERVFEKTLRGVPGTKKVEIDAKGQLVRLVKIEPPLPGDELYLTIDSRVQYAALKAMGDKVGAVVALDPRDGSLIAMVSTPGFDPGVFLEKLTDEKWKELNDKRLRPLLNKAIQDVYPLGSVFKIVMALGALQGGFVTPQTTFTCNSYFRLGRRIFRCWDWRGHGETDLYKALVQSCDVYFYQVGLKMGIDNISRFAQMFGLGERTGIKLPGERKGLVPSREWKRRVFKEPWQKGETLNTSIGQGFLSVTPLQAAVLMATVANEGTLYEPNYIEEIRDHSGMVIERPGPTVKARVPINHSYFRIVKKALVGVVEDKKGTGRRCRIKGIEVGGKTGTAQVVKQKKRTRSEKLPWEYRDHAWFVAYAPADRPKIAVAVLIEHGGHGGSAAAPVAKEVIEAWLETQRPVVNTMPGRAL